MPKVELLPATPVDSDRFLQYVDENFRRIADTIAALKASDIGAGIFSGALEVTGDLTVDGKLRVVTAGNRSYFWDGLELAHSASTPFIDFHRSTNPEEATDFDTRFISSAGNAIRLTSAGGDDTAKFQCGILEFPDTIRDNKIQFFSGYTIGIRSGTLGYFVATGSVHRFYVNNVDKFDVQSDGIHSSDWIRCDSTGVGIYFTQGGGGWYCNTGSSQIIAYNNANIECNGKIVIGGAGSVGYESLTIGGSLGGVRIRQRSRGATDETEAWVVYCTNDIFYFYNATLGNIESRQNVGGVYDWRVGGLPVISGTTLVRAGSGQIGPVSSTRQVKQNIRSLPEAGLDNPIWKMRPVRFSWIPTKIANAEEANTRCPDGFAGLIAEELYEVAPDAVHLNEYAKPISLDERVLIGYIVDAVQYLKKRVDSGI